jgi:hypothetical protein
MHHGDTEDEAEVYNGIRPRCRYAAATFENCGAFGRFQSVPFVIEFSLAK